MYVSGAIGFYLKPDLFLPFTPFTLLYTSAVFLIYQPIENKGFFVAFFLIALIGYISEVIGVKTGMVFGEYYYGSTLGYKLFEVPLTISLNWALLAASCVLVTSYVFKNKFMISFVAASMATAIDVLLEQLAPQLNFWFFKNGHAERHNYIGWFAISFVSALLFEQKLVKGNKQIALIILCLQLLFFGLIYTLNY